MPPIKHSELGASGSSRWINCPASVRMSRLAAQLEKRPEKSSVYANEGTLAHSVCERLLRGEATVDDLLNSTENIGDDIFVIDDDMVEAALIYITTIKSMVSEDVPYEIESRFSLDWLYKGMFGTCDCCAFDEKKKTLFVFDFKYGRGHAVRAKGNTQLMYYALGVLGPMGSRKWDIDTVTMTIVQPRNRETGIDSFSIPVNDLYRWAFEVLLPAAKRTTEEDAPCVPGEETCRFCRGVPICPEQYNRSMCMINEFFPVVEVPETPNEPVVVAFPPIEHLTPEQVRRGLDLYAAIKPYFEELSDGALDRMKAGEYIPGYKLVHKRSSTKWADPVAAEAMLRNELGDNCFEKKLISPAKAKKIVDKALVSLYTETTPGDITIASESDKREAVKPD